MAAADGIAPSILKPSRIESLGRFDLRVIEHIGEVETRDVTIQVYPFERILSLKQRIAETYGRENIAHLPEYLFIATAAAVGQYAPLEFVWNIEHDGQVRDPLHPDVVGQADVRLFDEAGRRHADKNATEHMGMLLEDLVEISKFRELHVWSLATLARSAGIIDASTEIPSDVLEGYFKLYFPHVSAKTILQDFNRRLSSGEEEDADSALTYHTELDKRLVKLDTLIPKLRHTCVLNQLEKVVYYIPPNPDFESSADLELAFYETKVSEQVPFVRYFPGNQRATMPLVKLAESTTTGEPIIDKALLSKMLRDIPDMKNDDTRFGVLMYKFPVIAPRVSPETMWTLTFFGRDGSATLTLQEPRTDKPLYYEAVAAGLSLLPAILTAGRINIEATPLQLNVLHASYRIDVSDLNIPKPNIKSLVSRIDLFKSFVSKSHNLESHATSFTLRYKTVSNYVKENNPIFDHLTYTTLDKGGKDKPLTTEEYIDEVSSHFGYSPAFAAHYVTQWLSLHSEYIERKKSIFDAVNPGTLIGLVAKHPTYDFILKNIQSHRHLKRILTLMSVLVSNPTGELVFGKDVDDVVALMEDANVSANPNARSAAAHAADTALDIAAAEDQGGMNELLLASLAGFGEEGNEVQLENNHAALPVEKAPPAPAVVEKAPPGPSHDVLYKKDQVDYLHSLYEQNTRLFKYEPLPDRKSYTRTCQASSGRQPNVMSFSQYRRARELYKDTVTWVEGPLDDKDAEAATVVSSAISSRLVGRGERKVYEMELRALELGFPLKGNKSVVETGKSFTKEEKEDMKRRIEAQQKGPPLWIVFRIGTTSEEGTKTNYYICAEYWCIHDNLPILPSVFEKTSKCPFCGGNLIQNPNSPEVGETVLKRKAKGSLHNHVGFFSQAQHPDGYAVPCCFTGPDSIIPPKGSMPFPPPQMELPPQQRPPAEPETAPTVPGAALPEPDEAAPAGEEVDGEAEETAATRPTASDTYRDRPFTAKRDKIKKNEWYIPHQKIIGRTNEGWVDITPKFRGIVSVPPQTVNTLLQQDPEQFLTAIRGVQAKSQNSYLAVPGRAFVRYGLGTEASKPGENLFSLIAFADYATAFLHDENANTSIRSNDSVLNFMTSDDPIITKRMLSVFEQANYGTLLNEFAVPQVELLDDQIVDFENWWTNTAGRYKSPSDKKYAIQTYLAFENFKAYLKNTSMKKELRYFMSFFTTPKLLTSQGFIPVVINYYRKNTPATIMCPEFGISFYNQPVEHRPPLLFIVHDVDTGVFDPLVAYEGINLPDGTSEQRVLGLIHPKTPSFSRLSPEFRSSIQGFIDKYFSTAAKGGCGVNHPFTHPWMPARDTSRVPRLSELIHVLDLEHKKVAVEEGTAATAAEKRPRDKHVLTGDIRKDALFRDARTNRLLGVIVRHSQPRRYVLIPCIDDGYIHPTSIGDTMKNVRGDLYDENATFKAPTIEDVFFVLTGKQKTVDETRIAGHFEAYLPVKLHDKAFITPDGGRDTRFVAVELACGIWIPTQPARAGEVRDIRGKYVDKALGASGASAPVDKMPWNMNVAVLGPERPGVESIDYTSEEEMNESYQLFRIAFSEWLRDYPSVREQIELLRRARSRLPLFELQKRLEILITAIVNPTNPAKTWFTTTDGKVTRPLYRRNCLKLKKGDCDNGCMWITTTADENEENGRCLIHTTATERYIYPVETLIARLVDELLRTFSLADEILSVRVPRLPSLQHGSIQHEDGALLFSLTGQGDNDLYSQLGYKGRKATTYTKGLVYPEETSLRSVFDEGDIPGNMSSEWASIFRHVLLGPELMYTDSLKFKTIFSQISGMPIDKYEKLVGHPIIGTQADWKELGERRKINIVFTSIDFETHLLQPYSMFRIEDSNKYVILDKEQIPFQHTTTLGIIMSFTDLPRTLKSWLLTQGVVHAPEFQTLVSGPPAAAAASAAPKPSKTVAAAPAKSAATKAAPKPKTYPVGKTKDDGNCFFSAVFRAAKTRGKPVLDQLAKCLGITAATEPKFIQAFRNKLAEYMKSGKLEPTYKRLKEVVDTTPANYAEAIKSFQSWFKTLFGEFGGELGTMEEFVNRYADKIKEDKAWVAQIDVEIIKQMLVEKGCNFEITIHTSNLISKVGELKGMTDDGKIKLNLYNKSEAHYEYFKMGEDAADEE